MGLFSFIGDAVEDVVGVATDIINPISDAFGSVTGILDPISTGLGLYNNVTGQSQQQSMAAINAQIAGQQATNAMNAEQAQYNREWQQWMSSTAHQREKDDLLRAGLNPILSVNKGAAVTGGAQATMQNPFEGTASAINEARKIDEVQKQQLSQERRRIENETAIKNSQVDLNKEMADQAWAATKKNLSDERLNNMLSDRTWSETLLNFRKDITEQYNQAYLEASAKEKLSNVSLNAADELIRRSQKTLVDYDVNERGLSNQVERYTKPVKSVLSTGASAVDLLPRPRLNINVGARP